MASIHDNAAEVAPVTSTTSSMAAPPVTSPTAPRKRRRRTTAAGAQEDCFTCRKRQIRCDRRRPYCSQCLEIGKDCSGYRTTLTWGVGVASRGKLRGLSLPIANSQKAAAADVKTPAAPAADNASTVPSKASFHDLNMKSDQRTYSAPGYDFNSGLPVIAQTPTAPIPIPKPNPNLQAGWHVPGFREHLEHHNTAHGRRTRTITRPRPLHRHTTSSISFAAPTPYDDPIFSAPSTASVSTFSESSGYPSPREYPRTPPQVSYSEPFVQSFPDSFAFSHDSNQTSIFDTCQPTTFDVSRSLTPHSIDAYMHVPADMGQASSYGAYASPGESNAPTSLNDLIYFSDMSGPVDIDQQFVVPAMTDGYLSAHLGLGMSNVQVSPLTPPLSFYHLPPRLQYLIDYFDKTICQALVASDSTNNPYRLHILELATHNQALQNSIAALSTCDIRVKGVLQVARCNFDPFNPMSDDDIRDLHSDPTPEELTYKTSAVNLFNASLNDPVLAAEDANLATLLVLCLYHVTSSGFSKFKTQLSGVQKLISMRDRRNGVSPFVAWIERFFTWFDIMTANVNDREPIHSRGDGFDMLDFSANLGAIEHLAACDGKLFKQLARMGRVSHHGMRPGPIRSASFPSLHTPLATPQPSSMPVMKGAKDLYCHEVAGWRNPFGGFASSPNANVCPSPPLSDLSMSNNISENPRSEFWPEWSTIKTRLGIWSSFDDYASMQQMEDPAEKAIQTHVTELFRLAAAMYTERLSSPHLPSNAHSLQAIVRAAMEHISALPSAPQLTKHLLWPISIIGTECVSHSDRNAIRLRLSEVARDASFVFNGVEGMLALERIWCEDDRGEGLLFSCGDDAASGLGSKMSVMGAQAGRWRRALSVRLLESKFVG